MRRSHFLFSITLAGLLLIMPYYSQSATLRVCPGCKYSTIQSAIDAANNRDTVQVERGDYREDIVFPDRQVTVRAIDGPQVTWIRGISGSQYPVSYSPGKSYRVLQGFRVSGGNKGGMLIEGNGGVVECQIVNNAGPGLEITGGSPSIFNTTISANRARYKGGGVLITRASVNIYASTITRNNAFVDGGGIFADNAKVNLVSSTIRENQKTGISLHNSQAYIQNSKIIGNTEGSVGGIRMDSSELKIVGSVISLNRGNIVGGIYSDGRSKLTMTNCTVANNKYSGAKYAQGTYVGGIKIEAVEGYESIITNCTVAYNKVVDRHEIKGEARAGGGIFHNGAGKVSVINSIVVNNGSHDKASRDRDDFWSNGPGAVLLAYSCVNHFHGQFALNTVIHGCGGIQDFLDVTTDDFHLRAGSKCIDAGTSNGPTIPHHDIDGDVRPQGARHDMGSDEFVGTK